MDIYDALRNEKSPSNEPFGIEEIDMRNVAKLRETAYDKPAAMSATEAYPEKTSIELANAAQALLSEARDNARRIDRRLKENEEQKNYLLAEAGRINDLIGRLEERKALTGNPQRS